MLTLARYAYKKLFPTQAELRVLLLGLDGSGKSALQSELQWRVFARTGGGGSKKIADEEAEEGADAYKPTLGSAVVAKGKYGGVAWCVTDIGGREKQRRAWANYHADTHFLVWCVDASSAPYGRPRVTESIELLRDTLADDQLAHCPLCVLVRGADASTANAMPELAGLAAAVAAGDDGRDATTIWEHEHRERGVAFALLEWMVRTARSDSEHVAQRKDLVIETIKRSETAASM
jgi:hypothetical protein